MPCCSPGSAAVGRLVNLRLDDGERAPDVAAAARGGVRVGGAGYLDDLPEGVAVTGPARQLYLQAATRHGRKGQVHVAEAARRVPLEDHAVVNEDADGVGERPPALELE